MTAASGDFAPPLYKLASPSLAPPIVTVSPTPGQGVSAGPTGVIPIQTVRVNAQTADTVATAETRSSATYGALATPGPQFSAIADGTYIVFWDCVMFITAGGPANMGISVNGAAVDATSACETSSSAYVSQMSWTVISLMSGRDNTITTLYKGDGVNSGSFKNRRLFALKVA